MIHRIVLTIPQLIAAGGSIRQSVNVQGARMLVDSDFPLVVSANGRTLNTTHAPHLAYRQPPESRIFEVLFSLPASWRLQAEVIARHGICIVEIFSDEDLDTRGLTETAPDDFPLHTFFFSNIATVIAIGAGPAQSLFTVASAWNINGKRPICMYVQSMAVTREIDVAQTGTADALPANTDLYEVVLRKEAVPAGDAQQFLNVRGAAPAFTAPVQGKLPLESIFTPYAVETPRLEWLAFFEVDHLDTTFFTVALTGTVVML